MTRRFTRPIWSLLAVALLAGVLAGTASVPTAEASRDFGDDPLDAVLFWANVRASETSCGLTGNKLAALMLAPIWPETGSPTTQAPGPMTMSRYDNQSALYSFSDPSAHVSAFWHPGIGMWQFDSAGGWGLTASERMSVWTIAAVASDVMAQRYCQNSSFSYVWTPWFGCNSGACETIYNEIYQNGKLVGLDRIAAVTSLGGVEQRNCSLAGGASFACSYVDPARAEGANGWANPAWGASPVSAPFYVFANGSKEERHWLRSDTGFAIDVSAKRPLGQNARMSLSWSSSSTLCDLSTGAGACQMASTTPPPEQVAVPVTINGSYQKLAGDFDGDGRDDVFWYAPGTAKDSIWFGSATPGAFDPQSVTVNGSYRPVVGDFDGDGRDDIFWYRPGTGTDYVWFADPSRGSFTPVATTVNGSYQPMAGDYDGDQYDDVFWYLPGSGQDTISFGSAGRDFDRTEGYTVNGTYTTASGDFDGNGVDDVVWYRRGSATDHLWLGRSGGSFDYGWPVSVSGTYTPVAADIGGDGRDDLVWHGHDAIGDSIWYSTGSAFVGDATIDLPGVFEPVAGDFDGAHGDDIFWIRPGSATDVIWYGD